MNSTLRTINARRSTRLFLDKPVSHSDIQAILHAANQAPSAHNQQSWRFIVLEGAKKTELANLVLAKAVDFPKRASILLRLASRSIHSAPVVVAIANTGDLMSRGEDLFDLSDNHTASDFFRIMEIQSSAAAVENLLLAATSIGLATVWLGVLVLIKDEILQFIGEPKGEFMAVIPTGYPAQSSGGPAKKPLETVVKYI